MDLREYLRIIRQQWMVIVACALVAIAAAGALTLRATPQYQSTASLFVSTPQSDGGSSSYQGGLFSQQRVSSYADLIKGKQLAQRVVDKMKLTESAGELAGRISATVVPDTVILKVTVQDPDPEQARKLADAVAEEFTVFIRELETSPGAADAPIKATIVDPAVVPTAAVSPQPLRNIALATLLGLLIGTGLGLAREFLDNTTKDLDTLRETAGAANLGSIFYDPKAASRPLVTDLDSHSPRLEAFRVLRTNLQFIDVDSPSKVFVLTSPLPGDGKSTTAVNLAITLAQAGQRTVLIEADLRRPKTSEYLGIEGQVGLTTVLIGKAALGDVIQPWGDDGLHVISAGALPPNPAELLQSRQMTSVVDDLRRHYDVVLIDAPPLLPVADAAVLSRQADGAILVVRHGKTTRDQITAAVERLNSVDAKLLGTVFNRTPGKGQDGYGYGYGYGYAPDDAAEIIPAAEFASPAKQHARTPQRPEAAPSAASPPLAAASDHRTQPTRHSIIEGNRSARRPVSDFLARERGD